MNNIRIFIVWGKFFMATHTNPWFWCQSPKYAQVLAPLGLNPIYHISGFSLQE